MEDNRLLQPPPSDQNAKTESEIGPSIFRY